VKNQEKDTMTDRNVDRAAKLDTATLSDALDRHGLVGQCAKIKPRSPSFRMAGRAWTLRYGPAGHPAGTVGDYIDDLPPGTVIVLDNGGREDCTVWGDILTEIASRKGIAGTLIDGINRDVSLCLELEYPVFSRDHWMRTGKDRVQVEATQVPVNIGNVRVCPGDLVRGDADGVVVIPEAFEDKVLDAAEQIQSAEDAIRDSVRNGMSLREARAKHKYHALQTRADQ
jgi:regulator of RNase E activity RraA